MEKEVKNQKIIITLLIGIIIVLSALFIYFVLIKKDNNVGNIDNQALNNTKDINNKSNNSEKNENLDLIADVLINKIDTYYLNTMDFENFSISDIPSQESLYAMFQYYQQKFKDWEHNYLNFTVSKKQVDDYFLKTYNIIPSQYPDYICLIDNKPLYVFDESKNSYVRSSYVHGHSDSHEYIDGDIYTSIKKSNDKYEITILKVSYDEGEYYVGGKAYSEIIGRDDVFEKKDVIDYLKNNVETLKNSKPQYKYVFEKVGTDYYLTSFEKLN